MYLEYNIIDQAPDGSRKIISRRGHTNLNNESAEFRALSWDTAKDGRIDIRLFYLQNRNPDNSWTSCRWSPFDKSYPKFYRQSLVTGYPICYTTEALKYAQTSFLVSIVMM